MHEHENNGGAPQKGGRKLRKAGFIAAGIAVFALAVFCFIRFYFPFGEGVKTGQLNFVVYKGVVFKTYEGRLIQTGFRSNEQGGIQSNEFNFSVVDKQIAEELMMAGGKIVELRYKEYFGALPWRGYSKFIVDEIINIAPIPAAQTDALPEVMPPAETAQ